MIGSGPAGLAAAAQLNRAGHSVTVFEKSDRIGGLLRYGIPEFKLEKRVLDRRLDLLSAEGVVFRTRVNVGEDVTAHDLRREFDAVLLAGGAGQPRDLNVPGRELKGVHFAMDYLTQQNRRCEGDDDAVDQRRRQARRDHRRRRHRRRLPRHRASPGRRVGRAARADADAAACSAPTTIRGRCGRTSSALRPRTKKAAIAFTPSRPPSLAGDDGRVRALHGRRVSRVIKDGRVAFEPIAGASSR